MIIILLLLILYFILYKNENFNQDEFIEINSKKNIMINLDNKLYTNCGKYIIGDARNNTYCYDYPKNKRHIKKLFKNNNFLHTKYDSYYYPSYSSTINKLWSNDWLHTKS